MGRKKAKRPFNERLVERYIIKEELDIITIAVEDSPEYPFETAVVDVRYREEDKLPALVCVACYETKEEALLGHKEWVTKLTKGPLPDYLEEVCLVPEILAAIAEGTHKKRHERLAFSLAKLAFSENKELPDREFLIFFVNKLDVSIEEAKEWIKRRKELES